MHTESFIIHIKTEDFYENIEDDIEKRSDASNYEDDRPSPTGKNINVSRLIKYEIGGKIMTESAGLRPKIYSYLMDNGNNDQKLREHKNVQLCKYLSLNIIKIDY